MPRRSIDNSTPEHLNVIDMKSGKHLEAPSLPFICAAIRHRRLSIGIEQKELAERIGVHKNAISNWERGRSRPDFNLIPAICKALDVSPYELLGMEEPEVQITPRENALISKYRKLEDRFRTHVDVMMDSLLQAQDAENVPELFEIEFRPTRLAAGSDAGLHDIIEPQQIMVHDSPLLHRANGVYKVNGDSMEPTFHDGDFVFVEDIPNGAPLHFGEIGAFSVGSETFIKEYQQDGLHSHNPHYPVMHFEEDAGVLLIGRVLGVVEPDQIASENEKVRFLKKKNAEE